MSNNCNYKKYLFSTDNMALPEFGAIDIMVRAGKNFNLVIYKQVGRQFELKRVSGDGYINTSGTTSGTFTNSARLYGGTEDSVFRLYDKYNLTWLEEVPNGSVWEQNFGGINLDDFEYCTHLYKLIIPGFSPKVTGSIASLQNIPLEYLDARYNSIRVDLIDLAPITTLKELSLSGNSVYGTISQINSLVNLTSLGINGTGAHVSGNLESLLDAMKTVRQNGDTFKIFGNGVIKYNGTAIANNSAMTFIFDGQGGYSVQS